MPTASDSFDGPAGFLDLHPSDQGNPWAAWSSPPGPNSFALDGLGAVELVAPAANGYYYLDDPNYDDGAGGMAGSLTIVQFDANAAPNNNLGAMLAFFESPTGGTRRFIQLSLGYVIQPFPLYTGWIAAAQSFDLDSPWVNEVEYTFLVARPLSIGIDTTVFPPVYLVDGAAVAGPADFTLMDNTTRPAIGLDSTIPAFHIPPFTQLFPTITDFLSLINSGGGGSGGFVVPLGSGGSTTSISTSPGAASFAPPDPGAMSRKIFRQDETLACRRPIFTAQGDIQTVVNEKVWAFQIQSNQCATWLKISPGLFRDPSAAAGLRTLNTSFGIRVYALAQQDNNTWKSNTTGEKIAKGKYLWTVPAWVESDVPWGGRPCNIFLELFTNGDTIAAGSLLELSVAPYVEE